MRRDETKSIKRATRRPLCRLSIFMLALSTVFLFLKEIKPTSWERCQLSFSRRLTVFIVGPVYFVSVSFGEKGCPLVLGPLISGQLHSCTVHLSPSCILSVQSAGLQARVHRKKDSQGSGRQLSAGVYCNCRPGSVCNAVSCCWGEYDIRPIARHWASFYYATCSNQIN